MKNQSRSGAIPSTADRAVTRRCMARTRLWAHAGAVASVGDGGGVVAAACRRGRLGAREGRPWSRGYRAVRLFRGGRGGGPRYALEPWYLWLVSVLCCGPVALGVYAGVGVFSCLLFFFFLFSSSVAFSLLVLCVACFSFTVSAAGHRCVPKGFGVVVDNRNRLRVTGHARCCCVRQHVS